MQENTNKAIAINSLINYAKMAINTILALLTTRFALKALGVDDFGLFAVVGSIISFIGMFNSIMLTTSNRYLAVAIGKNVQSEINKQFNVNNVIFIAIAIFMLLIAYPIGHCYINNYINYNGPLENAMMVFSLSIIGSAVSTLATSYNGLLMAKEKFIVFSSVEVFAHLIRFVVTYLLMSHFEYKLFIYTLTMAVMTAFPTFVYWLYCNIHYRELVKWKFVKDKNAYKEVLGFSGWISYGAIATVAKNQGAALLVNTFFDTIMNTALGIANSLNAYVVLFANNLTQPMQPQITKCYVEGNIKRTNDLLIMSTKYSFMLMLLIGCPFFVGGELLLRLWLGEVPAYALSFTILLIVDNIIQSFNSGISTILFASGKIALYQVLINTLRLLSIVIAYILLKNGAEPQALFYTYMAFSVIGVIASQWCLKKALNYDVNVLIIRSYIPSLSILLLFIPVTLIPVGSINVILRIIISILYLLVLDFFIGLSSKEKQFIYAKLKKRI